MIFRKILGVVTLFILVGCSGKLEDDYIENGWALNNYGQIVNGNMGLNDIDVDFPDYDLFDKSPFNVIAIIDDSVNFDIDSLGDSIYVNHGEIPDNDIDDDGNGYIDDISGWDFSGENRSADDFSLHSTKIAALIVSKNMYPSSVSMSENIKILSLNVIENGIAKTENIVEAIEYAENQNIKIVIIPITFTVWNQKIFTAMERSEMIFICAAGNDDDIDEFYPAAFNLSNVISVGAINNQGFVSRNTNRSPTIDVYAPGSDLYSVDEKGDYEFVSGTSFATAFVAVAALYTIRNLEIDIFQAVDLVCKSVKEIAIIKHNDNDIGLISFKSLIENIDAYNKKTH